MGSSDTASGEAPEIPVGGGRGCCGTMEVQEENGVEGAAQVQKGHGMGGIVQQSAGGRMCKYKKAMGWRA